MKSLVTGSATAWPISVVEIDDFQSWLEGQSPHDQQTLSQLGITGKAGQCAFVPGSQPWALALVSDGDFWSIGSLLAKLPKGIYALDEALPVRFQQRYALVWALGSYRFDLYRTVEDNLPKLNVSQAVYTKVAPWVEVHCQVRDWINTPAEDLGPQDLSEAAKTLFQRYRGTCSVIEGDRLLDANYPMIHAVGRASSRPPCLIDADWGQRHHPRVTLVGKGVCFDTGGLDLKSASGMLSMKKDMGGAAHVLGLAQLIMHHDLPVRLRVLIPAVDNAVAGNSYRPGDVLTSRQGLRVEVTNTDAEGRLILADALSEAAFEGPDLLIDMATLTGAARVALGTDLPAFFATDGDTAESLMGWVQACHDPLWRMPLYAPYRDQLKSKVADLSNAVLKPYGGAITAALFLQSFVNQGLDWMHVDLMAANLSSRPGRPEGGEAMGLRALFSLLCERYDEPTKHLQV